MDRNASPSLATSSVPSHPADARPLSSTLNSSSSPPPPDASIWSQLTGNQFFAAGFGLAALGAAAGIGRRGFKHGLHLLRRRMLVDVEVTRHDDSYEWLLRWITSNQQQRLIQEASRQGSAKLGIFDRVVRKLVPGLHHLQMQTTRSPRPDGSSSTHFNLIPGPGRHILRYGPAFIAVNRTRERAFDTSGKPFETITLTTLYAHRHVFEGLFAEAHELAAQAHEGKTIIFTSWGTEWRPFGQPKRKRPLNSVVLAEGLAERIHNDVTTFLEARTWYLDRGIPYRRGYLLHGPPGTGKSSFIQALAGALDFNIAMLNLSEVGLTDDRLMHLLSNVPPRTIVLLEDADAAFRNRRQADADGYRGANVTFSGLLNALDGVASAEERLVFLTTNHVERLDSALVRPGRVDLSVRLGEATAWQVERLWDRFYSEEDASGITKAAFVKKLEDLGLLGKISTAALQGLFLYNKGDPAGAVAMAEGLRSPMGNVEMGAEPKGDEDSIRG